MNTRNEADRRSSDRVIPLAVPQINGNEWVYVKECLDTNWVSSVGSFVNRFEEMIARQVGVGHAVATVNGTAALHIALLVAGIEPDDEVLVSDLTFVAPVNAVRYVGAWPVLIDAEPRYWQMDVHKVHDFIEHRCSWKKGALYNQRSGRRLRAMVPVHLMGHPVDMDPLLDIAQKYDLVVIEDAAESLGAAYKGRPVGSLGDVACFSFNGNKIVTSGGGGMIVTSNPEWADRARYLTTQAKDDPVEYVHNQIGYNYRLTNIQAALGVAQLERLNEYVARKRSIARAYEEALSCIPGIETMQEAAWASCTYWLYTILVPEQFPVGSRDLLRHLSERSIQTRPLWSPVHLNKPYRGTDLSFPVAEKLHTCGLSLPCSVSLSDEDQARVVGAVSELFGKHRTT